MCVPDFFSSFEGQSNMEVTQSGPCLVFFFWCVAVEEVGWFCVSESSSYKREDEVSHQFSLQSSGGFNSSGAAGEGRTASTQDTHSYTFTHSHTHSCPLETS